MHVDFVVRRIGIVNEHSHSYANRHSLMTPRTRRITDHAIAHAAADLLVERGPAAVTFAEVSQQCGLAPPTLVQRFGTKDRLIEVAAAALRERVVTVFAGVASQHGHLLALGAALRELAGQQLALLQLSRSAMLAGYSLELRKQISFALAAAVEAGELPRCDVAQLARRLQIVFTGAAATAALEGTAPGEAVGEALSEQLAEYV